MPAKVILGYIVRDEAEMLAKTLPKVAPYVDGLVAVDAVSQDNTVDVLQQHGATVESRPWTGNYGEARNHCIALGRTKFPDAYMVMIDADEAFLSADLLRLPDVLSDADGKGLAFPRYEFVDDLFHFNPYFYPDVQSRCFPLNQPFHYQGALHEQLCFANDKATAFLSNRLVLVPYIHIFHYGKTKPIRGVWLKYENYRRMGTGEPLLNDIPPNAVIPQSFSHGPRLVFHGERPL